MILLEFNLEIYTEQKRSLFKIIYVNQIYHPKPTIILDITKWQLNESAYPLQ